jgi:hypothetical protein
MYGGYRRYATLAAGGAAGGTAPAVFLLLGIPAAAWYF